MIIKKNKGKKKKNYANNLSTPKHLFKLCQKRWRVKCNIDVCATPLNRKCRRYISKRQNFLKQFNFKRTDILWCNFPHAENYKFVKHLAEIIKNCGCKGLLLIPINTLTSDYAEKYLFPYVEISKKMIIKGRHRFLNRAQKPSKEISVNGYVTLLAKRRKNVRS